MPDRTLTDCWEWTGKVNSRFPYGQIGTSKGIESTHRVSYRLTHGSIPAGMLVCHKCDNPRCVNPNHLWLGSYKDNASDMIRKGRGHGGPNAPRWADVIASSPRPRRRKKLLDADIIAIHLDPRGARKVGKAYGVSPQHVTRIQLGQAHSDRYGSGLAADLHALPRLGPYLIVPLRVQFQQMQRVDPGADLFT